MVTECREDALGYYSTRQALRVRRGNCEPVTVAALESPAPVLLEPTHRGHCGLFGVGRAGYRSVFAGSFVRVGVSPDGSVVVFELTDDFSIAPGAAPPPLEEGIYSVGADGHGLRRLGPTSRAASFRNPSLGSTSSFDVHFHWSPDGRTIVFTDRGPGPSGEDAIQIATLDVTNGKRTQVTRLLAAEDPNPALPVTSAPLFVDGDTIVFFTYADLDGAHPDGGWFRIHRDGSGLEAAATPIAIPGSQLEATFEIGGGGTNLLRVPLPGTPIDNPTLSSFFELFVLDGRRVLQLTDFRRTDTGFGGKLLDRRARRGYFTASADPLGQNPSTNCQLFSIDTFGRGLRQLTHFREADQSRNGCGYGVFGGCAIGPIFQDDVTKTIVFYSACDPLGTGVTGGQVFTMRPDGTGLRQLSATRGMVREAGGVVSVELPGPVAYSSLQGGRAL